jgi:hypothetical protein
MTTGMESNSVVKPTLLWSAGATLYPRIQHVRDRVFSFYERDCGDEVRGPLVPPAGVSVAANTCTFPAVFHQAKGRWPDAGNPGQLRVREIYAGGPPIPGGRVA